MYAKVNDIALLNIDLKSMHVHVGFDTLLMGNMIC